MSKYQAYPEYKDSGVKWLGKIPASWSLSKMAWNFKAEKGKSGQLLTKDYCGLNPGKYAVYSGQTENNGVMGRIDSYEFDTGEEGVLFSTTVGAKAMHLSHLRGKFSLSQNCMIIVPITKRYQIRFSYYHFQPLFYYERGLIPEHMQASFRMEDLYQYPIALPSLKEQELIANFLDYETAKIDTLIDKQQQLIKLLKEKRQAVISHAVTKGLNPNAPMRDSGVEWLGEVPEHWVVKRLKHISPKVGVGLVINPSTYTKDEGVYFIFGGDVKEYYFDLSKTRRISPEDSDNLLPSRLNYRDLVSIRVGYPGITAVVTEELEGSNCASVIVIRRGEYNSDWLCAAMNVWVGRQQVELASYGAAQKQFNVADAIEFIFPVPPESEQDEIANFIDGSLQRFNTLSNKAEKQIELLKERRTALISAAVTGKIDVRHPVCHPTGDLQSSKSTVHGDL